MPKLGRAAILIILMLCLGCAGAFQGYGRFQPDDATAEAFLQDQVNPSYAYFYSGSDAIPNAIMGVDRKYTLQSSVWKPVDLTPARLKTWVGLMGNQGQELPPAGQAIMDSQGNQVGAWFSYYEASYVKMLPDNGIEVGLPDRSRPYYNMTPFDLQDW